MNDAMKIEDMARALQEIVDHYDKQRAAESVKCKARTGVHPTIDDHPCAKIARAALNQAITPA